MTTHSPLHELHVAAQARFADFAGWSMPLEYAGTVSEHTAVREAVGVFDVSHLGTLMVRGPGASLNTVMSNDLARIGDGQAQYTLLLNESGGVVDDLIVYRISDEQFLLVPNAANCAEVAAVVADSGLEVDNIHEQTAIIAVQGPGTDTMLAGLGVPDLDYMEFASATVAGVACTVCRTGYTGERGVEILVPAQDAVPVWEAVVDAGAVPCGLGARDTLRTEMGYPLHGHELRPDVPARWSSVSWAVGLGKGEFIGRQAYAATAPEQKVVGLRVTGRGIPRADMEVVREGQQIGVTTSGTFSPTLKQGIALARVNSEVAVGDHVDIVVRGRPVPAEVTKLPFVPSRVRA
jgi:aminomethyltransferase